jgi:hypothetical protein
MTNKSSPYKKYESRENGLTENCHKPNLLGPPTSVKSGQAYFILGSYSVLDVQCYGISVLDVWCYGISVLDVWCYGISVLDVQCYGISVLNVQCYGISVLDVWCYGIPVLDVVLSNLAHF